MLPRISIIIPIYNSKVFLDRCLRSVLQQTMKDIEIICIDDCSSDDSHLVVEKYIKQDSRIRLIRHKKNKGSGAARNTGILEAKADYIASVDSDDYIKPEMMKVLWDASSHGKSDVVCCGFDRINGAGDTINSFKLSKRTIINNNNNIDIFTLTNPAFWNKLWKKALFFDNNIFFPIQLYYEDLATVPRLIAKSHLIKTIDEKLYCYQVRSGSVTTTYSLKHIRDYFKVFDILRGFLEEENLFIRYKGDFLNLIDRNLYSHSKNILATDMQEDEMKKYLSILLQQKNAYLSNHFSIERTHKYFDLDNIVSKKKLISLLAPRSELKVIQKAGSIIFAVVFKPLINKNQLLKLSEDPRSFFKESKNRLTRLVGVLLRIT